MILVFDSFKPEIAKGVYLAPGSQIIGNVIIKKEASIWPNAVIRGDVAPITIGFKTNVQDNSTLHVDDNQPLIIGDNVTIGHGAIVHSCHIEDSCLIGMGATILSRARIGKGSIVGAGAVVTENTIIPAHSLVLGVPGKIIRELSPEKIKENNEHAEEYHLLSQKYD